MNKLSFVLLALFTVGLMTSCTSNKRGYDYKKHHKKSQKAYKKGAKVHDLTRYNCREQ
jgi:hypothetical protein